MPRLFLTPTGTVIEQEGACFTPARPLSIDDVHARASAFDR
jgi:hypothetical protein